MVLARTMVAEGGLGFWDWAVVVLVAGFLIAFVVVTLLERRHRDPDGHRVDESYSERLQELREPHDRQQAA